MTKQQWLNFVIGIGATIALVGGLVGSFIGLEQAFVTGITAGLVYVTAFYVYLTSKAVQAANRQAEASKEMVQEIKEERLAASQPVVVQRAVNKLRDETIETGYLSHFSLFNAGNGTAIGLVTSVLDERKSSVIDGRRETFLKSGEEIRFDPDVTGLQKGRYYLFCQYMGVSNLTGSKSVDQTWLPFNIVGAGKKGEEVSIVTFDLSFEFDVSEDDAIKTYIIVPDHK